MGPKIFEYCFFPHLYPRLSSGTAQEAGPGNTYQLIQPGMKEMDGDRKGVRQAKPGRGGRMT
jgi:hypothetical protein